MKETMTNNKSLLKNFHTENRLSGKRFALFLVLYEFSTYIANDMIMPGMIQVINEFHAPNSYVPTSLTAYLLGGGSLQIFLGPISDRYGRRKVMLFGSFFFLICSVLIGISNSIENFMIARFFQGMGLCFIGVVGYASIQEMFPEKEAVKLISWMAIVAVVAPMMGPLLGGVYTEYFHWRGIYGIIFVLALSAFFGLWKYMPETAHLRLSPENKPEKKPDLSGLPAFRLGLIFSNYKQILKNRKFLAGSLSIGILICPLLSWISISPILLIEHAHLSSLMFGVIQIPIFVGLIFGNLILQKLTNTMPLQRLLFFASLFIVTGLLSAGVAPLLFHDHYLSIIIPLSVYTIGLGIGSAPLNRLVLFSSSVPKGSVSAIISLFSMLMMSGATAAMSVIYKNQSNTAYGFFLCVLGLVFIPLVLFFQKEGL